MGPSLCDGMSAALEIHLSRVPIQCDGNRLTRIFRRWEKANEWKGSPSRDRGYMNVEYALDFQLQFRHLLGFAETLRINIYIRCLIC